MDLASLKATVRSLRFPDSNAAGRASEQQIRSLREYVAQCIANDEFLIDAIERDVERRDGAPGLGIFDEMPDLGVRFSLCYWSPHMAAGAHEHSDWTVTAVIHNELEVVTYDFDATVRAKKVVPKNRFTAHPGQVGHIYRHSIHNPRNQTRQWAVSFHVTTPRDRPVLEGLHGPIEGLGLIESTRGAGDATWALVSEYRRECVRRVQIDTLKRCGTRGVSAIEAIASRGRTATRWHARAAVDDEPILDRHVRLVRHWNDLTLQLVDSANGTELHAVGERMRLPLLRAEVSLKPALEFVATTAKMSPADIPGADAADRLRLARALVHWGLFESPS